MKEYLSVFNDKYKFLLRCITRNPHKQEPSRKRRRRTALPEPAGNYRKQPPENRNSDLLIAVARVRLSGEPPADHRAYKR